MMCFQREITQEIQEEEKEERERQTQAQEGQVCMGEFSLTLKPFKCRCYSLDPLMILNFRNWTIFSITCSVNDIEFSDFFNNLQKGLIFQP